MAVSLHLSSAERGPLPLLADQLHTAVAGSAFQRVVAASAISLATAIQSTSMKVF